MKAILRTAITIAFVLSVFVIIIPIISVGETAYSAKDAIKMAHNGFELGGIAKLFNLKDIVETPVTTLLISIKYQIFIIVGITIGAIILMNIMKRYYLLIALGGVTANLGVVVRCVIDARDKFGVISENLKKYFENNTLISKFLNGSAVGVQLRYGAYIWCLLYIIIISGVVIGTVYYIKEKKSVKISEDVAV